ncbi:hypothetical protein J2X61_004215 [Bacillus sp. 3255]|nr:hypothetical protein [Bacillus sp. 3255]
MLEAVKAYEQGETPMEIFLNAGFDISAVGIEKPKKCLKWWKCDQNYLRKKS